MWLEWNGNEHDASAWVHQCQCRVRIESGKVRMYVDGWEFFDPSVEDMAEAKRTLERAAFRRSGGRSPTALRLS
jgi:hypothetical protein